MCHHDPRPVPCCANASRCGLHQWPWDRRKSVGIGEGVGHDAWSRRRLAPGRQGQVAPLQCLPCSSVVPWPNQVFQGTMSSSRRELSIDATPSPKFNEPRYLGQRRKLATTPQPPRLPQRPVFVMLPGAGPKPNGDMGPTRGTPVEHVCKQ